MPEFNSKATITISCGTSGATIRYTTNGNDPTSSSTQYSAPFTIYKNMTIKALGIKSGLNNSSIASYSVTVKLPTPTLSASVNGDEATVTISNASAFASNYGTVTFRYTTDGSEPSSSSPTFTSGQKITSNCTVKVKAFASNNVDSASGSVAVSGLKVDTPVITAS